MRFSGFWKCLILPIFDLTRSILVQIDLMVTLPKVIQWVILSDKIEDALQIGNAARFSELSTVRYSSSTESS